MKELKQVRMNKFFYISFLLLIFSHYDPALARQIDRPALESFESDDVLGRYKAEGNARLSLSSRHFKFGQSSLRWDWEESSTIGTAFFRVLSHEESPLAYGKHFPASPTLIMSVYNENPQNERLKISFEKEGIETVWFEIELTFLGWRTIWVPFYEMSGNVPKRGEQIDYDYFSMSIASDNGKGSLFIDDVVFSQFQDDRHSYPDKTVPFIKKDQPYEKDHWMPQMMDLDRIRNLKTNSVDANFGKMLVTIEERLDVSLAIAKKYKVYINDLKERFSALNIRQENETVQGPPLTYRISQVFYDEQVQGKRKHNEIAQFGKIMKKLASYYDRGTTEEKEEIKQMFVLGVRYYLDQGWQEGASGGTRHHIGYNTRELTEAFYMMRKPLEKEGLLNAVGGSLQWLFNLGKVLGPEEGFYANIDYLNTQSFYHLLLIFLTDDIAKQHALLSAYSNYMTIILAQDDEIGKFKVDGTGWHHNGHYPAYALGAFRSVPKVMYALSGTAYRIGTAGHQNFRKAFLATRLYSQTYDIGFGNAGRHPLGDDIRTLKQQYLFMANSGNPEHTSVLDREVASAYLRLWGDEDPLNSMLFTQMNGIEKEKLDGYYTFPYAATAVHRRDNWVAIMKGYSKYVWASEIYVSENRYGRYPANGTIQLFNEKGNEGSGFQQEGWDWNRYPGSTIIYLPFEELEPDTPLIMFRSEETFAGAVEQEGNGAFGMILNESKGSNADGPESKIGYPGKLKAYKSVFSFGDKLVCVGTGISSVDTKNPTQTNLFQSFLPNKKMVVQTSEEKISKLPSTGKLAPAENAWIIDPYNNGYHILSADTIYIQKKEQNSYHSKYSIRTGKMHPKGKGAQETVGNFASAWIDHGLRPDGASYRYVIYPALSNDEVKKFGNRLKKEDTFEILRADNSVHIVLDKSSTTTAYVIFEANDELQNGVLQKVSEPALIMIRDMDKNAIKVSVVQPDLNFNKRGNKYSNFSQPVSVELTLEGIWISDEGDENLHVKHQGNTTSIVVNCQHGFTKDMILSK